MNLALVNILCGDFKICCVIRRWQNDGELLKKSKNLGEVYAHYGKKYSPKSVEDA